MIKSVVKKYDHNDVWTNSYILTLTNGEVWDVPKDTANRHYLEILEWVADGNTIEDAE
tara:strand:- start:68 stop:241 length:174 start_codon:yes stop_codon:yes gene_type:complete